MLKAPCWRWSWQKEKQGTLLTLTVRCLHNPSTCNGYKHLKSAKTLRKKLMLLWADLAGFKITLETNSYRVSPHSWATHRNPCWTIWHMPRESAGLIAPKNLSGQENSEICWFMNTWWRPNCFWNHFKPQMGRRKCLSML